ncbi:16S rRNA (uracil(1498)-N(3))-methyltransferase [Nocardioides insulae]|uniref:16S rRNA (uracil(1498)-N(3))-methyltransferase n=1 Tax=Nocardioides insulae TaxID=394734 RepID=UPI0004076706|nr:16S rRNA (uracil(1498)-N(3))-methyltransferase [Nocardioides insulae]
MSLPVHLSPSLAGVAPGETVTLEGDEAHHAVAVRRLRVGEQVMLTDGAGTAAVGEVAETGKRRLSVTLTHVEHSPEPDPAVTVIQALPKGDRGELAVEVLTEVGCARIVPWAAARSVAVWKGERATRSRAKWQSTAREAAKQSRRAHHPEVSGLHDTQQAVDLAADADLAVVLHEEGAVALASVPVPESGRIVVVVGPEGGLTAEEIAAFEAVGAQTVKLGAEVLRTSTAGVVAVAALLARTPRWA